MNKAVIMGMPPKTNLELVKEWHLAFGVPVHEKLTLPPVERFELRKTLIEEESQEVINAMISCDNRHIAKELCDLLYVVYGTALEFGLTNVLDECFREVHRANMSKLGPDGKPIYREDGKVLKGPNYKPADLTKIIK